MKQKLDSVIARRRYMCGLDDNRTQFVEVEVSAPRKSLEADEEFQCSFRVAWPGSEHTETVYGIDELQALQLALGYLEGTLRNLSRSSGLALRWAGGEGGDFGIRIPQF